MFRKTLIKLTVFNSAIFILIIGLLGTAIYLYTQNVLYRSVDHSLKNAIEKTGRPGPPIGDFLVSVYLWDDQDNLIGPLRARNPYDDIIDQIPPNKLDQFEDRSVGHLYFRIYSTKILTSKGWMIAEAIKIINPEKETLRRLLIIILTGCGIGLILALIAGYILARRALRPIQQSWEKQQEFVSDASHELRTPLAIIQSRIEILLQAPQLKIQDKLKDISVILQENRRLSKLVSNLLTLARSDNGHIEVKQDSLLLNELIPKVVEPFEETASYQGKKLTLDMAHYPIKIFGDKEKIHQLLVILLDNAMKFTNENGKIALKCGVEAHQPFITVTDNGFGISKENLPRIFDRFFQADPSRSSEKGTGLGLSIAKWIVDKHRGRIIVESEVFKGTTIKVLFPKNQ